MRPLTRSWDRWASGVRRATRDIGDGGSPAAYCERRLNELFRGDLGDVVLVGPFTEDLGAEDQVAGDDLPIAAHLRVGASPGNTVHDVHALDDAAEHREEAIHFVLGDEGNEELTAGG